jgi:hypothetical protein
VKIGVKYLCRLETSNDNSHFVTVVKSAGDVLKVFLTALCAADWKFGQRAVDGITTKCTVGGEQVTAMWYQSPGRFPIRFVTVRFPFEGESVSLTIEESDARDEINLIEKRVRECICLPASM